MGSIDERIVSMSFVNAKFEAGVAETMRTLAKLNQTLATVGATTNFANLEKESQKVTLLAPMSALDKLKARLGLIGDTKGFTDIESASQHVTLLGPQTALDKLKQKLGLINDTKGFTDIESASQHVTMEAPLTALDKLRQRLGLVSEGTKGFSDIERASQQVTLKAPNDAIEHFKQNLGGVQGGASTAFQGVEAESGHVSLAPMASAVANLAEKFGALKVTAVAALATIVSQVTQKAASLAKALTLGPITAGLDEYSTNLQSIQTILANTKDTGGNLKSVNAALQELNYYSDKTIYNFSEMAKNIGTFTAAGVDLKTATGSIKGIANLAALSGSSAEQASTAMYQLSQAIAAGRVSLQDWNSVVNAGMGGAVFQKALVRSAVAMGSLNENAVKVDKTTGKLTINGNSFRESITARPGEKSWLDSKVLTGTLQQFTGDLSDAQLAAQGFTADQIKAIQAQAKTAKQAATESKSLKQVWDVTREAMGSGWSATWQIIFGDFMEAKTLFTNMATAISNFVSKSAKARNAILGDWKKLGGRTVLIDALKTALHALGDILGTVKAAFREVFPRKTGKDLFELTKRFHAFTEKLKASPETLDKLKRSFAGAFAILHIGVTIVKKVFGALFKLLGFVGKGSGGFLSLTASVGDTLVAFDKAINSGNALGTLFHGLGNILKVPIILVKTLAHWFLNLFGGDRTQKQAEGTAGALDTLKDKLKPLGAVGEFIVKVFDKIAKVFHKIKNFLDPFIEKLSNLATAIGKHIVHAFDSLNFDHVTTAIQTGLLGAIFLGLKKALGLGGVQITTTITGISGNLDKLNKVFGVLVGNLRAIQRSVQAATLLLIGAAILSLAAGVKLLSTIKSDKLASSMGAVAAGLGQLVAVMAILGKAVKGPALLGLPAVAAGMVLLAGALILLGAATKIFSSMDWEALARGLAGVAGVLVAVAAGTKLMGPQLLLIGPGLIAAALGLNLMAVAVKQMADIKLGDMAKGILGMGAALVVLGTGLEFLGPSTLLVGPGLIAVSIGLALLGGAVGTFGSLKLETLAKGVGGIAAALVTLGLALEFINPVQTAAAGASLIVLAAGLTGVAGAVAIMGKLKIGTVVKGLASIGAALVIFGVGLEAMDGTLPGALALLAAATALALLAPTLAFMGHLSWGTILKGLATMALTLATLALIGSVAAEGLLGLGVALGVLAVAVAIAGGGLILIAKAISMLGTEGPKGLALLIASITALIALIPKIAIEFAKGMVGMVVEIAKEAPVIAQSLGILLDELLSMIITMAPKFAQAAGALILAFLKIINDNAGPFITAGLNLLQKLLQGIASHIQEVTKSALTIIVRFLGELGNHADRLATAGLKVLVHTLAGVTKGIPRLVATVATLIAVFVTSVAKNLGKVIAAGSNLMAKFIAAIAKHMVNMTNAGVKAIVSLMAGIGKKIPALVQAAVKLAGKFVRAIGDGLLKLTDIGATAIIRFINGLADVINRRAPAVRRAGWNLAWAMIHGLLGGFKDLWHKVEEKLAWLGDHIPGPIKKALDILSPSGVFREIGGHLMSGLVLGIDDGTPRVLGSVGAVATAAVDTIKDTLTSPDINLDIDPTITPVLDLTPAQQQLKDWIDGGILPADLQWQKDHPSGHLEAAVPPDPAPVDPNGPHPPAVSFEQNNYSPKELSEIEIYRRTANALSQMRGKLGGGVLAPSFGSSRR